MDIITIVCLCLAIAGFTIFPMIAVRGDAAVNVVLFPLHYSCDRDLFPDRFTDSGDRARLRNGVEGHRAVRQVEFCKWMCRRDSSANSGSMFAEGRRLSIKLGWNGAEKE